MDYVVQLAILVYWTIGIYVHGSIYMAVLMRQFHPSKIWVDAASVQITLLAQMLHQPRLQMAIHQFKTCSCLLSKHFLGTDCIFQLSFPYIVDRCNGPV